VPAAAQAMGQQIIVLPGRARSRAGRAGSKAAGANAPLLTALKDLATPAGAGAAVAPYVRLHDRTLVEICRQQAGHPLSAGGISGSASARLEPTGGGAGRIWPLAEQRCGATGALARLHALAVRRDDTTLAGWALSQRRRFCEIQVDLPGQPLMRCDRPGQPRASFGSEIEEAGFKAGSKVLVVEQPRGGGPVRRALLAGLNGAGFETSLLAVRQGGPETPATVALITGRAFQRRLEGVVLLIVALGRRVVGGHAGFCCRHLAAGYRRGFGAHTLLAIGGRAIGGKPGEPPRFLARNLTAPSTSPAWCLIASGAPWQPGGPGFRAGMPK